MKNQWNICIVIFVAITSCGCTEFQGRLDPRGKLLIDTDVGGDDAIALLMAIGAEKFDNGSKIIGITCVNGNADVDQVALNVLKVLKVANRLDIPVFKGASHPLLLPGRKDHFFGKDAFGDFYYPDPPSMDFIQSKHAVNAMIDFVKSNQGQITLVALGPLTNIALAIRMYPSFLDELYQIIIMGGSVENMGIARPGIEFNFAVDPIANYIVFHSFKLTSGILVPWETSTRSSVTLNFRQELTKRKNKAGWLIDSIEHIIHNSTENDIISWECPDAVTISIALTHGSIITKSNIYYVEAIYDGTQTSGMIIVDYQSITGNRPNVNIVQKINLEIYKRLLYKYFTYAD